VTIGRIPPTLELAATVDPGLRFGATPEPALAAILGLDTDGTPHLGCGRADSSLTSAIASQVDTPE
jgi:hypothetical protein